MKVEREKRLALVKEIRDIEWGPHSKPKPYDPTTTAGIGLLEEMSIIEL